MTSDSAQREEALDPSRSFIVEAPAGSGKTGLLVQRMLRLLTTVDRPEAVVAMTFTRKAAKEMKERLVRALQSAHDDAPPKDAFEARTRQLASEALHHNPTLLSDTDRLQVQTIDSLCAMLTRQMPVLSDFGGVGEVVEDPRELYTQAAREMFLELTEGTTEDQALFHRMSLHFDNNMGSLEAHLVKMLNKRDQWEHIASVHDSQLVTDFCALLKKAGECLRDVFQRSGKVDFVEIGRAARRALGTPETPTDLLYSLDYRIQHLLVDEFQDTSRAQYDLVKALTEQWSGDDGHTLFVVGDPMQSIYGFREAEVSLFLRLWESCLLGGVRLHQIRLQTNFRTTAQILSWVENAFTPVMPEDNEQIGAVKFRTSIAGREDAGPEPKITALVDDKGAEEAAEIAQIIRQDKTSKTIAILVRSRSHIAAILPAFRNAGITYEAIEIDVLQKQQHVMDLFSLTRALVHLADRVSWLACLRAPWCGLTLGDLSMLAEEDEKSTIFDLLSNPEKIAQLSVDGRWRAIRFQETIAAALQKVGRTSLRGLVNDTWRQLGGEASLSAPHQLEDAGTFLDMLESMEEGGTILDFSLLSQKLENLFAKPAASDCRVKVMTAHQAKGLEFDAVIIPQMGRSTRANEQELLVWTEEEGRLEIAALPGKREDKSDYNRINEIRKKKDEQETARLFYVACTRAKNCLYLLGSADSLKEKLKTPGSGTFLRMLWTAVSGNFEKVRMKRAARQAGLFNAANQGKTSLSRLPVAWKAPAAEPSIQWKPAVRRAVASGRPTTYEWVSDTGRHTGTVVHELLKRMSAEGLDAWSTERVKSLAPLVGSELMRLGAEDASERVLKALSRTLASARGRWILGKRAEQYSEWALVGSEVSGTVDRAFRDDDGRFWIIDFKTGEHKGGKLTEFLKNEKRRYSQQLESYASIVSNMKAGPIFLGLYFPLLDEWLEWEYTVTVVAAS